MHINQLLAYGLLVIACVLILRWRHPFGWFDQFSLCSMVTISALLQNRASHDQATLHAIPIELSQLYMLVINNLLAGLLVFIVYVILVIMIIRLFFHLINDFAWIDRQITRLHQRLLWLDQVTLSFHHLILLSVSITNILLLWLHSSQILRASSILSLTRSQLLIIVLSLSSLATLIRMSRALSGIDRGLILLNVIIGALLLFTGYVPQTSPDYTQIMQAQAWLTDLHLTLPIQTVSLGLALASLVSLMWIRRRIPQFFRSLLKIGFGLTFICALVQWIIPAFLLITLIALTLSLMIATQVEQL